MKIALLGAGKTGGKVSELHENTVIFNQSNKLTLEKLSECDVVISFLPGDAFVEYIDVLIESKLPVVTGSTGFDWPKDIDVKLKEKNLKWVRAHNFSLGMNIVKSMIEYLGKAKILFDDIQFNIHDIHHVHKKDSPSGTALSWKEWLDAPCEITAERTGDVIGYHHVEMTTPVEKIKLTHEALDRAIFAQGAIWSAQKVLSDDSIDTGLTHFSEIVKKHLNI